MVERSFSKFDEACRVINALVDTIEEKMPDPASRRDLFSTADAKLTLAVMENRLKLLIMLADGVEKENLEKCFARVQPYIEMAEMAGARIH